MAGNVTTRTQVSGYRFHLKRMDHALIRGDVRMLTDPLRAQNRALTVGLVIAVLGIAGCGVLAVLDPRDRLTDSKIAVGRETKGMYVQVGDTFHPVTNLASARLILGETEDAVMVNEDELAKHPRGPMLGILGAPSAVRAVDHPDEFWTVCDTAKSGDDAGRTSVIVGVHPEAGSDGEAEQLLVHGENTAVLVRRDQQHYLIYRGTRARVDIGAREVVRAFGLDGIQPREVNAGFLSSIPEVPPLESPTISDKGENPNVPVAGRKIGEVVQVNRAGETQHYVILADGVQAVGETVADLIRFTDSLGARAIPVIPPDAIRNVPTVTTLAVESYPAKLPTMIQGADIDVICGSWGTSGDANNPIVATGRNLPLPAGAALVQRVGESDPDVLRADDVYIPPGSGRYVYSTVAGHSPRTSQSSDADHRLGLPHYVSDTGVRYGVSSREDADALGIEATAVPVPWNVLKLLDAGPALTREDALVQHAGVPANPNRASPN
ncbi:type VII secretion protein EccB [Hoyosella rhizosphaerae]|uniref:Type VII secretion protein EccB n=1 Tax=Hoyosella rhizosphaerae TaxID=1755582 RepID=A0A916ULM7_9ACTN|nr:type VII secretion protein EccB [Hoyosella rhizosphaerae]MBN4925206.1 type VII secretion protein EccB [Hoyosella rhizosphaerae]GGC77040.1 hypothetical protein GCM10011410_32930 [Hoyosella rhizosphaerae]